MKHLFGPMLVVNFLLTLFFLQPALAQPVVSKCVPVDQTVNQAYCDGLLGARQPCDINGKCRWERITETGPAAEPSAEGGIDESRLRAQAAQELNKVRFPNVQAFIGQGVKALMAFVGSILLALYIYAGILYMISRGNSVQIDKAKNIFVWSTLGVVVMLASYVLVSTLFGFLK